MKQEPDAPDFSRGRMSQLLFRHKRHLVNLLAYALLENIQLSENLLEKIDQNKGHGHEK